MLGPSGINFIKLILGWHDCSSFRTLILLILAPILHVRGSAKYFSTEKPVGDGLPTYTPLIVNFPYHVLIAYDSSYCSGALIRSKIVVTAASCFVMMQNDSMVIVKVGAMTVTDIGQVIEVVEVKKHEYFAQNSNVDNDIAMVVLREHVTFNPYVKKIILAEDDPVEVGTPLVVSGWGSSNLDSRYTGHLLCSQMIIENYENCSNYYNDAAKPLANFCVKYLFKYRLSDNGGPAVYKDQLVGVLSFGANRMEEPFTALVTNVTYFSRWIFINVQRMMEKYCAMPTLDNESYYDPSEAEYEAEK